MKANRRSFQRDERAVSEMVGSVLLVGITVVMSAILALTVFSLAKPIDPVHSEMAIVIRPGSNGWGTGDEGFVLQHLGGESVTASQSRIRFTIAGTATELTGAALVGAFLDGFHIGETWTHTVLIPAGADVRISLIVTTPGGATQVLTNAETTTQCDDDEDPPFVAIWSQAPPNVNILTTGTVTVTATIDDFCSGIDTGIAPQLRVSLGGVAQPPITMTSSPGNVWRGVIPDLGWSSHVDEELAYYLDPLTDLSGNSGSSAVRTDLVDDTNDYTYVETGSATRGSLLNFPNMRSSTSAVATLQEASLAGTPTTLTLRATSAVDSGNDWANEPNIVSGGTNNQYVTSTDTNPSDLRAVLADPGGFLGTITSVVVKAEVSLSVVNPGNPDGFRIRGCIGALCGPTTPTTQGSSTTDTIATETVADLNGGGWTWTDVRDLEINIDAIRNPPTDGVWRVDHAWVEVTYTPITYDASATFGFPALPGGATTYTLEILYTNTTDGFIVQVFDGTAFVAQPPSLSQTVSTLYSHLLTPAELAATPLQVRIVDLTPTGSAQGFLDIDYMRVHRT